jgi:hypothetical protein
MTTNVTSAVAAALLIAAAGCGGDHVRGSDAVPAAFATLATDVSAAAGRHRANGEGAGPSGCAGEMSRYGAELRPMLDRMEGLSGDMDACVTEMGHASSADMQGTCAEMRQELERHLAGGCAAADPAAEAARHAGSMQQLADREAQRSHAMGEMMGSRGGMMSGRCGH